MIDETSDIMPPDDGGQVENLNFYLDGQSLGTLADTLPDLNTATEDLPWRPYAFAPEFQHDLTTSIDSAGVHTLLVETTENAADNKGSRTISVSVSEQDIPGDPGGTTATVTANIALPEVGPPPTQIALWHVRELLPGVGNAITIRISNEDFPTDMHTDSRIDIRLREVDGDARREHIH